MSVYENFKIELNNPNSTWTILSDMIKPGSKVLDVGCSSGYFAAMLALEKKCVVDGIELDKRDAEQAKKVCRQVAVENAETMDFKKTFTEKYDYIIFADVLEHLLKPSETLTRIAKTLTDNGQILFSIPNMANAIVRLQLLQGNFDYEKEGLLDRTHLHFYTKKTIVEMVKASGLKMNYLDGTTFDTPKSIIDKCLDKVGLAPTQRFYEFITSKDALVYQYVGSLGKAEQITASQAAYDKTDSIKPKLSYEKEIKELQLESRSLFKRLKSEEKKALDLSKQVAALEEQIDHLLRKPNLFSNVKNGISSAKRMINRDK